MEAAAFAGIHLITPGNTNASYLPQFLATPLAWLGLMIHYPFLPLLGDAPAQEVVLLVAGFLHSMILAFLAVILIRAMFSQKT